MVGGTWIILAITSKHLIHFTGANHLHATRLIHTDQTPFIVKRHTFSSFSTLILLLALIVNVAKIREICTLQPTVGSTATGKVGLGYIRKLDEKVKGSKPVNTKLSASVLQVPASSSYPVM